MDKKYLIRPQVHFDASKRRFDVFGLAAQYPNNSLDVECNESAEI